MKSATGWKVFAALNALLVVKTIVDPAGDADGGAFVWFSLAMSAAAALGLVVYAFGIVLPPRNAWKALASLYGAYSVCIVGMFINGLYQKPFGSVDQVIGVVGALAVIVALQYFSWLGLNRYAQTPALQR